MKKIYSLLLTTILLSGCGFLDLLNLNTKNQTTSGNNTQHNNNNDQIISYDDYGAFLGRSDNNSQGFDSYNYLSFEFDEFTDQTINTLNNKGIKTYAYLNVGSLETYRDYYNDFKDNTIGNYENWEDEKWIDVTNTSWQNYIVNTVAAGFKNRGAFGVYMDNVDVYSYAIENSLSKSGYANGLKNIIKGVSNLGLKVMINGGAEFLDDMNDAGDDIFDYIWGYHQEEVFSLIEDYDNNIFGTQDSEDSRYYKEILEMMGRKNKNLFMLEYTTNQTLKDQIKMYCEIQHVHFYIASDIDLI